MVVLRYYGKINVQLINLIALQTGVFYTGIGKSNQEIAALSAAVINHKVLVAQRLR
jgi:hypothetical protein